ncbi:RNA polymerase primary sigma factor [Thiobaca trueperi]|uniref:RNA polymerase primary sigma factor n=1 Tax=Thiobaca trueperi TaxID=127458 RepID=A0A4V2V1H7_9GAMM|nr:RNA polymerase primary sigma factor [Thiobaca trueperi]
MDESRIDRVVKDLVADHDRRDGSLPKDHVERLFEKRQLSVEEGAEVFRQLSELGISLEEEPESLDDSEIKDFDADAYLPTDREEVHEYLALKWHIRRTKLLTAEEEVDLGRRMALGRRAQDELDAGISRSEEHDSVIERAKRAKEAMVMANLRLVLHVAIPFVGFSDLSLDDLFQEGVTGLMRAADKYDHALGYRFSTYSMWWIRQSVTRSIADRGATIRLPVHAYLDVHRFRRARRLLEQTHPERRIRMHELADELAWTIDKVHFIQQVASFVPASLDDPIEGHDDFTLMDSLVSNLPSPTDQLERSELARCVEDALGGLKQREIDILRLRFGLSTSGYQATLEEIGLMFGVTRERIRQIEAQALARLRHPSRGTVLREFLDS